MSSGIPLLRPRIIPEPTGYSLRPFGFWYLILIGDYKLKIQAEDARYTDGNTQAKVKKAGLLSGHAGVNSPSVSQGEFAKYSWREAVWPMAISSVRNPG